MSAEDVKEALNLFDRAARKDDRWWFLVLLLIGMAAFGYLIWDTRQQLAARDVKIESLHENIETTFASLLKDNTRALDRNTAALDRKQ